MKLSDANEVFPCTSVNLVPSKCSETLSSLTLVGAIRSTPLYRESNIFYKVGQGDTARITTYSGISRLSTSTSHVEFRECLAQLSDLYEDGDELTVKLRIDKASNEHQTIYFAELISRQYTSKPHSDILEAYLPIPPRLLIYPLSDRQDPRVVPYDGDRKLQRDTLILAQRAVSNSVSSRPYTLPSDWTRLHQSDVSLPLIYVPFVYSLLQYLGNVFIDHDTSLKISVTFISEHAKTLSIPYKSLDVHHYKLFNMCYTWIEMDQPNKTARLGICRAVLSKAVDKLEARSVTVDSLRANLEGAFQLYLSHYTQAFASIQSSIENSAAGLAKDVAELNTELVLSLGKTLFLILSIIVSTVLIQVVIPASAEPENIEHIISFGKLACFLSICYIIYQMVLTRIFFWRRSNSFKLSINRLSRPLLGTEHAINAEILIQHENSFNNRIVSYFGLASLLIIAVVLIFLCNI